MPLCICERNTRFSIGIWGKVVASTCWIAAVFASVVDIEVSLGSKKAERAPMVAKFPEWTRYYRDPALRSGSSRIHE